MLFIILQRVVIGTEGHRSTDLHSLPITRSHMCSYQHWSHTRALCGHVNRARVSTSSMQIPSMDIPTGQHSSRNLVFFHMHPTAEGHQFVPRAYPGIIIFVVLSSRNCRVWIKYTTIFFFNVFFKGNIFLRYISILSQSIKVDKWSLRNVLLCEIFLEGFQ